MKCSNNCNLNTVSPWWSVWELIFGIFVGLLIIINLTVPLETRQLYPNGSMYWSEIFLPVLKDHWFPAAFFGYLWMRIDAIYQSVRNF